MAYSNLLTAPRLAIAVIGWFAKVRTAKGTEDALMAGDAK
jgi:hypothetical protein